MLANILPSFKPFKEKKCFLDIGKKSNFRFMSLDFGNEKSWTESNFVFIDGKEADFQPNSNFDSISSVNFHWLAKDVNLNLPETSTSTGLFIFNSASNVNLYFHDQEIKGLIQFVLYKNQNKILFLRSLRRNVKKRTVSNEFLVKTSFSQSGAFNRLEHFIFSFFGF